MRTSLVVILGFFLLLAGDSSYARSNPANVGFEDWYFRTDDDAADIYVCELGKGEPVVVLHGGPGAEHSGMLDALKGLEGQYRFILYDQRGSLRSPCKGELISVDKHIQDLESLRKELGLNKMTLFGHSWGTYLALSYLKKYPDRVKNLVLTGAVLPKVDRPPDPSLQASREEAFAAFRRFAERREKYAELEKVDHKNAKPDAKQRASIERINVAAGSIYHVERWRQLKGVGPAYWNGEANLATNKSWSFPYDFTQVVTNHPYSITVINGDHDSLDFGGLEYRKMSTEVPKIELVIFKNAGHVAWIDAPDEFRKALSSGLSKTTVRRD